MKERTVAAGPFGRQAVLVATLVAGMMASTLVADRPTLVVDSPVRLILDTDIQSDVDDVGAVAVAHALADRGEAELLGFGVSVTNSWSVLCLNAINTYFGRGDLPIGMVRGEGHRTGSRYAERVASEFPRTLMSADDVPDAAALYREILAAQPDNSVVMVSVGQVTNFRNLLQTEADEHSDLDGRSLVERKVRLWVCMGGRFPSGREYNIRTDAGAAAYAIEHWPTTIVFSGYEIGHRIGTGRVLREAPENSPIRRAYELYNNITDRHSWDQVAVLYAVRGSLGHIDEHWSFVGPGRATIDPETGNNSWSNDPDGRHWYKVQQRPPHQIAEEVEGLMMHQPAITILRPSPHRTLLSNRPLDVELAINTSISPVQSVSLKVNGEPVDSRTEAPWILNWSDPVTGSHELTGRVRFEDGTQFDSNRLPIHVLGDDTLVTPPAVTDGLIAFYPLDEEAGRTARNRLDGGMAPDLILASQTTWADGLPGLHFNHDLAGAASHRPAERLIGHLRHSGAFTIELWLEPDQMEQGGPARLFTLSRDNSQRNLTIGHGTHRGVNRDLVIRLRTPQANNNGMPDIVAENVIRPGLAQYVVTFADEVVTVYRDGESVHRETRGGDLSNWADDHLLGFGNEVDGDRAWRGQLHRVAIYDRALDASQVRANFEVGLE